MPNKDNEDKQGVKKSAWTAFPEDDAEFNSELDKTARKAVRDAAAEETGGLTKRRTYTEDDARDPFSLTGHSVLKFLPVDYMQKNNKPTPLILSPFAKLTTHSRSKLDARSTTFSQLASSEIDRYLSVLGFSYLVRQFGVERVLKRYSHDEVERVLQATNEIQSQMADAQTALQKVLLSNNGELQRNANKEE